MVFRASGQDSGGREPRLLRVALDRFGLSVLNVIELHHNSQERRTSYKWVDGYRLRKVGRNGWRRRAPGLLDGDSRAVGPGKISHDKMLVSLAACVAKIGDNGECELHGPTVMDGQRQSVE
jgi:hypothetical protein